MSKTVAKEEEARKKAAVIEGRLNPAKTRKSPRFDVFTGEYLDWLRTNKQPRTVQRVEYVFRWLHSFFGPRKLNELMSWHVEQYKKVRKEEGAAVATVNIELAFLRAMLKKAQEWKRITEHPP